MAGRTVVGAVVVRDGLVLAARRSTPPLRRWEFPGGKVEAGETPRQALVREIEEELGLTVEVGEEVTDDGRPWPISEALDLRLFLVHTHAEPAPGGSHDALRWVSPEALDELDWLESDRLALAAVRSAVAKTG